MIRLHLTARRAIAAASVALAALAATLTGPVASAAEPELLLSDDGVSFGPALHRGLFDDLGALVPLEPIESRLWVRNASPEVRSMRISVNDITGASDVFTESVTLTAVSGTHAWTWTLAELSSCDAMVPTMLIAAGETVRFDLTAELADVSGRDVQGETARIGFRVAARDARSPFPTDPCAGPTTTNPDGGGSAEGPDGGLSGTGADVIPLTVVSVGLIAAGFFALLLRRRRDEDGA